MKYILISDIHSNITALRAVITAVAEIGVSNPCFWLMGDLLGYGPKEQAAACLDWFFYNSHLCDADDPSQHRWVPGNHDEWAASLPNSRKKFSPEAQLSLVAHIHTLEEARPREWGKFKQTTLAAIEGEKYSLKIERGDDLNQSCVYGFVHAAYQPLARRGEYLYPWKKTLIAADLRSFAGEYPAVMNCLIAGHTHTQMLGHLEIDDQISFQSIRYGKPIVLKAGANIINPGSIGVSRDGDPRAAFAVLDTVKREVTFYREKYKISEVTELLRLEMNASLTAKKEYHNLIERLKTGCQGSEEEQNYHGIYHRPDWDLIAS